MIKILIKSAVGILMIPVAIAATASFYNHLMLIKEMASLLKYFVWGIAGYALLHLLFYKPTYLYVLGHEAVHAGMSWIFGGKIMSFKASKNGGSVKTDKSNFITELAPYFIPLYAIIITVIYFLFSYSYQVDGRIFVFLIGFTLAFHIISTIEVMKTKQPDIMKSGYIFSVILVYTLNIVVISVIFNLMFPAFSIKGFFVDIWSSSKHVYVGVFRQLFL